MSSVIVWSDVYLLSVYIIIDDVRTVSNVYSTQIIIVTIIVHLNELSLTEVVDSLKHIMCYCHRS